MLPIKIQLPDGFLNEEIRDGYKVTTDVKKLWAVLLDLLNEFMSVCDRNNIKYYACAGTILGAARHRGIIPWDDDIDVMMFREDYEKLCAIAEKEFRHPYFFQTEYTDKYSCRGHAQLRNSLTTGILSAEKGLFTYNQGIFLDVFPLDNVPDDIAERRKFLREIKKHRSYVNDVKYAYCSCQFRLRLNVLRMLYAPVKYYFIRRKTKNTDIDELYRTLECNYQRYNTINTQNVMLTPLCMERYMWPVETFQGEMVYLPFEMLKIPVPIGYVQQLNITYGNWQKFVIGGSVHGSLIADTEKPYTEYI